VFIIVARPIELGLEVEYGRPNSVCDRYSSHRNTLGEYLEQAISAGRHSSYAELQGSANASVKFCGVRFRSLAAERGGWQGGSCRFPNPLTMSVAEISLTYEGRRN
jgi:hypothetical protein